MKRAAWGCRCRCTASGPEPSPRSALIGPAIQRDFVVPVPLPPQGHRHRRASDDAAVLEVDLARLAPAPLCPACGAVCCRTVQDGQGKGPAGVGAKRRWTARAPCTTANTSKPASPRRPPKRTGAHGDPTIRGFTRWTLAVAMLNLVALLAHRLGYRSLPRFALRRRWSKPADGVVRRPAVGEAGLCQQRSKRHRRAICKWCLARDGARLAFSLLRTMRERLPPARALDELGTPAISVPARQLWRRNQQHRADPEPRPSCPELIYWSTTSPLACFAAPPSSRHLQWTFDVNARSASDFGGGFAERVGAPPLTAGWLGDCRDRLAGAVRAIPQYTALRGQQGRAGVDRASLGAELGPRHSRERHQPGHRQDSRAGSPAKWRSARHRRPSHAARSAVHRRRPPRVVAFLSNPGCCDIHGQTLHVDGGYRSSAKSSPPDHARSVAGAGPAVVCAIEAALAGGFFRAKAAAVRCWPAALTITESYARVRPRCSSIRSSAPPAAHGQRRAALRCYRPSAGSPHCRDDRPATSGLPSR